MVVQYENLNRALKSMAPMTYRELIPKWVEVLRERDGTVGNSAQERMDQMQKE